MASSYALAHALVDGVLRRIEAVSAILAGVMLLAIMTLVSLDALLRHLFAAPLTFQLPLSESYLLVACVMLSLAWGFRRGGSVQVTFLIDRLPPAVVGPVLRLGLAAASAYLFALAWWSFVKFHDAWVRDEVVMGVIDWPVGWSWMWVPPGCLMLSLRVLVDATAPTLRPLGAAGHE